MYHCVDTLIQLVWVAMASNRARVHAGYLLADGGLQGDTELLDAAIAGFIGTLMTAGWRASPGRALAGAAS
jgi:hypothetical protein